jgi:transcriptional regulator with XRE-family HTH domain
MSTIDSSKYTQKELAEMIGYKNPNMITMIKQGHSRLAIEKIPAASKALNIDPVKLYKLVMMDANPEVYEATTEIFGEPVTNAERKILAFINEKLPYDLIESKTEIDFYLEKLSAFFPSSD